MHRGKQIIYVSHCVLNQNAVIRNWERAQGAFNNIVRVLLEENVAIIQLPCPEFTFLGENRSPKTKEEYDNPEYRRLCAQLAESVLEQMTEYINNDYQILGIVGIQESPSCDTSGTKGIFMEELITLIKKGSINISYYDIPEGYIEGESEETTEVFRNYIRTLLDKCNK